MRGGRGAVERGGLPAAAASIHTERCFMCAKRVLSSTDVRGFFYLLYMVFTWYIYIWYTFNFEHEQEVDVVVARMAVRQLAQKMIEIVRLMRSMVDSQLFLHP